MECIVCCDPLEICAKYSCNHIICYRCATKLLFSYNDKQCPLCKSASGKPMFENVNLGETEGGNLKESKGKKKVSIEDEYATYGSTAVFKKVQSLLQKKCKKCKEAMSSNKKLIEHYKLKHSELLCDVCIEYGHQFWFEHTSYKPEMLIKHQKGKLLEPGFPGHIFCPHCEKYLFNTEEAKKHCHAEHQLCTVCELLGIKFQFYKDYSALEEHYRAKHYRCDNSLCIKNHCYVYAYKSELWTHCLTEHSLDIKLGDIETGLSPNPPVCSIDSSGEVPGGGLYRQSTNIVTPLVNEPYFPSFSSNNVESARNTTNVPAFMDRSMLHQSEYVNNARIKQLRFITKSFYNEINNSIEKYIEGSKTLEEMVKEIEVGVGDQTCLKVLNNVSFLHRNKEVGEFLKTYKQSVMFPKFKKEENASRNNPKPNISKSNPFGGYKVLDLSKKK